MFRCGFALLIVWTIALSAAPAQAQWFSNFMDGVHRDYHRNKAWPEPFLRADRESVNIPFGMMIANGWRKQNLISDYLFQEDSPKLTMAGEQKLRFILTQMPPTRRTVFVQRGTSPDVTANRIAVVQRTAAGIVPLGTVAEVVESDLPNDGWPADDIDAVAKRFNSTRPDPRIRSTSSGGGSGGGSGSGGSGS